jgi:hypothetical protein
MYRLNWVTTYSDGHVKQDYFVQSICSAKRRPIEHLIIVVGAEAVVLVVENNASTSTQPIHYPTNY